MSGLEAIGAFMVCFGLAYPLLVIRDSWKAVFLGVFLTACGYYHLHKFNDLTRRPAIVVVVPQGQDADEAEDQAELELAI